MYRLVLALLLAAPFAIAQQNDAAPTLTPAASERMEVQQLVEKQFGTEFQVAGRWQFDVDLNGDGIPDAVIEARSKDPLLGEGEFHYKVLDPYNDFFGYGNPKVTLQFKLATTAEQENMVLLVIHGAGSQGWRASVPSAKFVLVNVPYQKLSFKRATLKKKVVTTIIAEDIDEEQAAVYWDGKKYKWEPVGSSH